MTCPGAGHHAVARALLCACLLLGVLATSEPAGAQLPVLRSWPHASPPCNGTLQACIDAALEGDGVEITSDGPIDEDIVLRRSIELVAAPGYAPVFASSRSVLWAPDPGGVDRAVAVVGLTFERGSIDVSHGQSGALTVIVRDNTVLSSFNTPVQLGANEGSGPLIFEISGNDLRPGPTDTRAIHVSVRGGYAQGEIAGNTIAMRPNLQATGIQGYVQVGSLLVDVIGNRITGSTYRNGVDLDQYLAGTISARVLGNLIRNATAGEGIRADTDSGPVDLWIANNTVIGGARGILLNGAGALDALVANNVIADSGVVGLRLDLLAGAVVNRHNLFHGNPEDLQGAVAGEGSLFADPRFAGPDDFRLGAGSPAIDAGDDAATPPELATDLAGAPRVQGARVDIGAFEAPEPGASALVAAGLALAALSRRRRRRARFPALDRGVPQSSVFLVR